MNNELLKKNFKYLPWVIVSALLQAISLTSFSVPNKIYPSGVAGISRLASDALFDNFNINIKYTLIMVGINLILSIIVYRHIGKLFTILSLTQNILVSILASILPQYIFIEDKMLMSIFGGIINGFGIGLALSHNASSGGSDFVSIYFANKYKRNMWNYIFGFNCFLIIIIGLLYGWDRALYSIIFQFCTTQIVNRMHIRYTSQTITIITSKPDEVSKEIFNTIRHGITEIKAVGAYKKSDTTMLYTVVNGYQTQDVVDAILKVDEKAFINIQDTKFVYGNYYQKPLD